MIEQRRARRFELTLPCELVRNGAQPISELGETQNVSSQGVLFLAEAQVAVGDVIEYLITLPTPPDVGRVRIRCLGKVVRLPESRIAATLERYEFVRNGKPNF